MIYWAKRDKETLLESLTARLDSEDDMSGMRELQRRAFRYYYGLNPDNLHATSQILRGGHEDELAEIRLNHSRSLVNTLLNLIVAPKLVWQPKAVSTDYAAQREVELAAAILEHTWVEKHVSTLVSQALEAALVFAESFILLDWDPAAGEDYLPEESGEMMRTGDVSFRLVQSWDVIRDRAAPSWMDVQWVIVRMRMNAYDLAERFPESREDLLAAIDQHFDDVDTSSEVAETDLAEVFLFLHERTPSMPSGRRTLFVRDAILQDSVLPLDHSPLYRVSAGEVAGSARGYTSYFEILGAQELLDSLNTTAATNLTTFGTQNIVIEAGSNISPADLSTGMRVLEVPPDAKPPMALNLVNTPAELYKHMDSVKAQQELLMGLNSVVRGEARSGEQSGSALALLQSQALQQSSTVQANFLEFVSNLGTGVIQLLQNQAALPRKISIVGKGRASLVTEQVFDRDSLRRIQKVQVEIGNPLSQTSAGRIEMAKELFQMGLVKTPEQYLQVLSTGRLEPLTQGLQSELMLIRGENEQLAKGVPQPSLILDDHALHIKEHKSVLANPEARQDPNVVRETLAHIEQHEQLYMQAPPMLLVLTGQQPPPQPMMPEGAPPPGGAPPPPDVGGVSNEIAGPQPPEAPQMPVNPATGQPWDPVTGGGIINQG